MLGLDKKEVQAKIYSEEDPFYRRVFDGVNKNLPNGTQIGVNGFGGNFIFPNKSRIEFIPHYEKDKAYQLMRKNTHYNVLEFLKEINVEPTDEIISKLNIFVTKL